MLPQTPQGQLAEKLGMATGQGIARNFPQPEQLVQRGMLTEAFNKLQQNKEGDYLSQLSAIAPTMLTTAGGAEALSAIAPILAQKARNRAFREVQGKQGTQKDRGGGVETPLQKQSVQNQTQQALNERPEDKFRKIQQGNEPESLYPQITAGPQTQKLLSPEEINQQALKLMNVSEDTGNPMSYKEARDMTLTENETIRLNNEQILKEQQLRDENIKQMSSGVIKRADSAGMIKQPEDNTVLEKLAYQYRNEKTPADQWEKVRSEFQDFERARSALSREQDMPGPFDYVYRKLSGTYKDQETIINDIQPNLDQYRKFGLFNEARNQLITGLGMGPELAERALFPPTKKEREGYLSFGKNKNFKPVKSGRLFEDTAHVFPGSEYNQNQEDFTKFKDDLSSYLESNPKANLIVLRGVLNQDRKYSWNDISRAVNELTAEGRFTPDLIQNQQIPIINQAPLPGMGSIFQYFWKGTK